MKSRFRKQFIVSGIVKFCNTVTQFFPSLIIARVLRYVDTASRVTSTPSSFTSLHFFDLFRQEGVYWSLLLFVTLTVKTALENQYFNMVIQLGVKIRCALSGALYRKSLRLSPESRRNYTSGDIVNYMQVDTNRIESVANSIHTLWDGLLQVIGYTSLLVMVLGPSVLAGIAAMLILIPFNANILNMYVLYPCIFLKKYK